MQILASSENELREVANAIITFSKETPVVLLHAEMAMGKTTLVKEICRQLGCSDEASSPTFSLVNEYLGEKGLIYHFDLYRIKDVEELYDIGFEEYLDSGYLCLVEWPELAEELMPEQHILVTIDQQPEGRLFSIKHRK